MSLFCPLAPVFSRHQKPALLVFPAVGIELSVALRQIEVTDKVSVSELKLIKRVPFSVGDC